MYLPYINKALELLDIMGECRVARSIHTFVLELVDTLLQPTERPSTDQPGTSIAFDEYVGDPLSDLGIDLNTFNFFGANFSTMLDDAEQNLVLPAV